MRLKPNSRLFLEFMSLMCLLYVALNIFSCKSCNEGADFCLGNSVHLRVFAPYSGGDVLNFINPESSDTISITINRTTFTLPYHNQNCYPGFFGGCECDIPCESEIGASGIISTTLDSSQFEDIFSITFYEEDRRFSADTAEARSPQFRYNILGFSHRFPADENVRIKETIEEKSGSDLDKTLLYRIVHEVPNGDTIFSPNSQVTAIVYSMTDGLQSIRIEGLSGWFYHESLLPG